MVSVPVTAVSMPLTPRSLSPCPTAHPTAHHFSVRITSLSAELRTSIVCCTAGHHQLGFVLLRRRTTTQEVIYRGIIDREGEADVSHHRS
jgi:hypothetical protein